MEVARVDDEVVPIVGRDVAVSDAAEIGNDDFETSCGQRLDVAPPDPLRLRVAVNQQQRDAANAFVDECQRTPSATTALSTANASAGGACGWGGRWRGSYLKDT